MASPLDNEVVVGRIESAEVFETARKPKLAKLEIDLGDETAQSAAQLLYHHDIDELLGDARPLRDRPRNGRHCGVRLGSVDGRRARRGRQPRARHVPRRTCRSAGDSTQSTLRWRALVARCARPASV
ncbi:MAG: hypothetical protein U5K28_11040 [Halobacteriales archaeon]|nr:hypothetical protein [Halobacteriales archaeon]